MGVRIGAGASHDQVRPRDAGGGRGGDFRKCIQGQQGKPGLEITCLSTHSGGAVHPMIYIVIVMPKCPFSLTHRPTDTHRSLHLT